MKRILAHAIALLLMAVPAIAAAQTPASEPPACWPAQIGGCGGVAVVRVDTVGMAIVWPLKRSDGTWARAGFWGRWSDFVPDWQRKAAELAASTEAAKQAAWRSYVTQPASTCVAELCPVVNAAWSAVALPSGPVWVVAKYSTNIDRPAYPWVNGARSLLSNGRALIGSPCDPAVGAIDANGNAWFGVNGRTDQVALCSKQ